MGDRRFQGCDADNARALSEVMVLSRSTLVAVMASILMLSILSPVPGRAEQPVRAYEMLGTDLIALNTALQKFRHRLPAMDVRDFDISVQVYDGEIVFVFAHKDRPRDIYGQVPEYPTLTIHVSSDGMDVLKWHFAR